MYIITFIKLTLIEVETLINHRSFQCNSRDRGLSHRKTSDVHILLDSLTSHPNIAIAIANNNLCLKLKRSWRILVDIC